MIAVPAVQCSSVCWCVSPVKESNVLDIHFLCYEIGCFLLNNEHNTTYDIWYWMSVGFFYPWVASQKTHHTKQILSEMSPKNVYTKTALLSASTSSSGSIVWDASFCLRCHFQPPPCLDPNGFLFVWLPRHIGAMLRWDRVHSGCIFSLSLSLSLPVCCSRVREAINKHCAFMVRSCVAQQGITHAAWLVLHSALLRRWRAHWIHQSSCTWVTYW